MKKKRERLFKDKDILIPIENGADKDVYKFLSHTASNKEKQKKVVAIVMPSKKLIKPDNSKEEIIPIYETGNEQTIRKYKAKDIQYMETKNHKGQINIIFKRKKTISERILLNCWHILKSLLRGLKSINYLFKVRFLDFELSRMLKKRHEEQLIALGSFWSTPLGVFIFRSSANAVGFLLMIPLLILKQRFYMTDIPNVERLGHAIANVDVLTGEFAQGMYKTKGEERALLIFYPQISQIEDIGFVYYPKINYLPMISKSIKNKNIKILYLHPWIEKMVKRALLKSGSNIIYAKPYGHRDIFNVLSKMPSLFTLSGNDEKFCIKYFEEKNFKPERPLILCSNRSSGNINYNNCDDKSLTENKRYGYRNSTFESLIPSIQDLLGKGYNVIKVGAASGVQKISDERFFDFSAQPSFEKRIMIEMFLFSQCLFFVGDTSGNYSLAQAFKKPVCFFNFAPFGHFHSWDRNSISIFKNIRNNETGKLEKFSHILKYQYGYEIHNDKSNIFRKYISNTKQEIFETVKEMEARISGSSYNSDEGLQRQFQKLFTPSYLHQSVNARCGDFFLNKYRHLL
jgi:putative glycosyltransferase (TIGR04372 family)